MQLLNDINKTGNSRSFEAFCNELEKHLEVFACKIDENKLAVICNDITKRKSDELNRIKTKENKCQMLLDSMTAMVQTLELDYDSDGQPIKYAILDTNQAAEKFIKKNNPGLKDKKAVSIVNFIEKSWLTLFADVDKTGISNTFENYGVAIDTCYSVTAWKISDNKLGVSYIDITKQKKIRNDKAKATLKLEKIEQKLAGIGSWLFYPCYQTADWSETMFQIWDFDSKKGTPEYDIVIKRIHTDDIKFFNSTIEKIINLATPFDIEFRICLPNNVQKNIRAICQPLIDEDGIVLILSGTNQDITEQKLIEEAQVKDQRFKAIGEMSSAIAHDFNNSLQGIMGNLEILKIESALTNTPLSFHAALMP